MSLSTRIFITCVILIGISIGVILRSVTTELVPAMRQSLEEVLVETSNLLAEIVEKEVESGNINSGEFSSSMNTFSLRRVNASIPSLAKEDNNLVVYITDANGRVIYDSTGNSLGEDYSQWNDVYLTLQGKYGARTTRKNHKDPATSVMYVAAPIKHNNNLIGVLSVGKPSMSVQPYFNTAVQNIETKVMILSLFSLVIVMLFIYWITLSIRQLTSYAHNVKKGKRTPVPTLREKELAQLADAMESMRLSLDGKNYIENYLHTLTHELKSPLAAIQGAAELLQEDMPKENQQRFVSNIRNESERMQQVVTQLLRLAELEKRQQLQDIEAVDASTLTLQLCEDKLAIIEKKHLTLNKSISSNTLIMAERFLIQQAISNLLDNAIEFSTDNDTITINVDEVEGYWRLSIRDHGPGIPDYAIDNIFDRFYSLPRPGGRNKSTGLGLSLVHEVAQLHHGSITICNADEGGVESVLSIPVNINQ